MAAAFTSGPVTFTVHQTEQKQDPLIKLFNTKQHKNPAFVTLIYVNFGLDGMVYSYMK